MNSKRRYLISIDGGGTKTDISILDKSSGIMRCIPCGGGNFKTHGVGLVQENIRSGLKLYFNNETDLSEGVLFAVAGVAGCDSEADRAVYETILTELGFPKDRLFVCNDSELIFRSLSDEPGLCLIAGTGSIVFGLSPEGKVYRSGGWGAPISDEGSGYWIGAQMIRRYLDWMDGTAAEDPFFENFRAQYPEKEADEIAAILAQMTPTEAATYAKPILRAYTRNDTCREIISAACGKLAVLTRAVYLKCAFPAQQKLTVIESGSLFKNAAYEKCLQEQIRALLPAEEFEFRKAEGIPAENGIRLAGKLAFD